MAIDIIRDMRGKSEHELLIEVARLRMALEDIAALGVGAAGFRVGTRATKAVRLARIALRKDSTE